jgi:hypothetical protein
LTCSFNPRTCHLRASLGQRLGASPKPEASALVGRFPGNSRATVARFLDPGGHGHQTLILNCYLLTRRDILRHGFSVEVTHTSNLPIR